MADGTIGSTEPDDERDISDDRDASDFDYTHHENLVRAEPAHKKAHAALRQDIMVLIEQHEGSKEKPPFSAAELVVMAMICEDKPEFSPHDLARTICTTYRYYERKSLDMVFDCMNYEWTDLQMQMDGDDGGFKGLIDGFSDTFYQYHVPITVVKREWWNRNYDQLDFCYFTITLPAARLFLEPLMYTRKGAFPFLQLPAELRNAIYELVLRFPSPGFRVETAGLKLLRRPEHGDIALTDENVSPGLRINTHHMTALLRVCKQTRKEALPIFYGINTFCSTEMAAFKSMTLNLKTTAVEHLRRVYMECRYFANAHKLTDVAPQVAQIKKFELLVLCMHDDRWIEMKKRDRVNLFDRVTKFTKFEQISTFHELAKAAAKADKFELRGECPVAEAFFDSEIKKIKAGKGSSAPKKRVKKVEDKQKPTALSKKT